MNILPHNLPTHFVRTIILTLLAAFLTTGMVAQQEEARKHIEQLKESVLLVRLQDRSTLISSLKERGLEAQIPAVIKDRDEENADIMQSFTDKFEFCPVYFFYASESQLVLDGRFDSLGFVGAELLVDDTIRPSISTYYVAEFTVMSQDTRDAVKNNSYRGDASDGENVEPKYVGGTEIGGHALVIMDSNFETIRSPFPSFTKTMKGLPFNRKYRKVVWLMNEKLIEFYRGR